MKGLSHCLLLSLFLLSACSKETPKVADPGATPKAPAPTPTPAPAPTPAKAPDAPPAAAPAANTDMDGAIKALMAKAEVPDASIEVQHILIAFKGSGVPTATRSKDEAKALAQKVYAEVIGGGDFGALVKTHTNDSFPGIYPMTKAGRAGMVKGFGDVGFRLKVGEIGVAPFDAGASPYGWHIIKRLK